MVTGALYYRVGGTADTAALLLLYAPYIYICVCITEEAVRVLVYLARVPDSRVREASVDYKHACLLVVVLFIWRSAVTYCCNTSAGVWCFCD